MPESQTDLKALRQQMIRVAAESGEGHLPSSLSVLELLWTLHNLVMKPDDVFLLSKGHAALALYVVLAQRGLIPQEWLDHFCESGAELQGHPELNPSHGISATTGSLGHGGPTSVGVAYALKIGGKPGTVYCLLGDQEMNEGSCWEAMLLANRFKLDNLVWIIDDNHSADRSTPVDSIGAKFLSFGWSAEPCSGHSIENIERALLRPRLKPHCIIANTIKGFGVERMEREPHVWHHKVPGSFAELHDMLAGVR